MKTIVLTFLILLMGGNLALPTPVTFSVLDMTGNTNDVTINIKPVNSPVIWNGIFYYLPPTGTNLTTTNGFGEINLIPGHYTAVMSSQPQAWTLNVTNSVTPVSAASLTTDVTFYSGVQNLTASGGVQITVTSPGTYNIDGSQISGGAPAYGLLYDEMGIANPGYLLFEP
jgi:hypothetical protein